MKIVNIILNNCFLFNVQKYILNYTKDHWYTSVLHFKLEK